MYCFSQFCRLCFRRDCKLLNLHTKDEDLITYNEKLKSCIPEIVSDEDRLPNFLCDICCTKLKRGYEFKIMCVKNHLALKDYAKQLYKYMESPNTLILNKCETESNVSDPKNDRIYSDSDSEDNIYDSDIKDEPLALVTRSNGENSQFSMPERVKIEAESEESDYQCEDLSKKTEVKEEVDERVPARDYVPKDGPGFNMSNDMVMKYLKLEYTEREAANRSNEVAPVERPENLCTGDSETEQEEEKSTWNTSVPNEPIKKMKTRTKDKYRIVYTENQRLELEKEFIVSRYITTSRKMQLSASLNLSQRQIKIWFQNRRAKERKQVKRSAEQLTDGAECSSDNAANSELNVPLLPTDSIVPQIVEVQKELFVLQRQKEVFAQQNEGKNVDELYKQKHEMLNHRLQLLLSQHRELNKNKTEASAIE